MSNDNDKRTGEVAGDLAEREADAINAAQPKADLETIGGVLIAAEVLFEIGEMTTSAYAGLRARLRAAIPAEDELTWQEYAAALRARCSKRSG